MTPKERVDKYLNSPEVRGLAKGSQETYRYALGALLQYCEFANIKKLDSSLVGHTEAFIVYTKETRGVTGKTIQYYCTIIRMMMLRSGTPLMGFTYRLTNKEQHTFKEKQVKRWLTEEDVKQCLDYRFPRLHTRNHLVIRLLVETGCRVREIANIKVRDVDAEKGSVYIGISKTTCRHVFVSKETTEFVVKYLNQKRNRNADPDRLLFDMSVKMIKHLVKKMWEDLDLKRPGRLTHVFRHWVATRLFYDGGMRLEDIAFLLGDSKEIIEKVYLHPTEDMLRKRVTKGFGWA